MKERDEAIEESNSYKKQNDILIECELNRINGELKNKYKDELNAYQKAKQRTIRRSYVKRIIIAVIHVLLYCSLILLLFGFSKCTNGFSTIVAFIIFLIPFIRPIVDHTGLRESFKLILFKHVRNQYIDKSSKEYDLTHKPPVLEEVSKEEVVKRLLSI